MTSTETTPSATQGASLAEMRLADLKSVAQQMGLKGLSGVDDFRELLPSGTNVYIAHIEGTPIDDVVATAARLGDQGFDVMPHLPARCIDSAATLDRWLGRYRQEAGVERALLIAGGMAKVAGPFASTIDMMATGLFEKHGFTRLHVAGHPEGNRDIDKDGSSAEADRVLLIKQDFARRTGIDMAIVTQFVFESQPVIEWAHRLGSRGIELPIHVGVAGPGKLQTLMKYALSCGVGPSLKVLQKRAHDVTRLLLPHEPTDVVADLAAYRAANPDSLIEKLHFFPLGGIAASADWAVRHGGAGPAG